MTKDQVLKILSQINYPGFSRDIVSFGLIDDISVSDENVRVTLKISAEKSKQEEMYKRVRDELESLGKFKNVDVVMTGAAQPMDNIAQSMKPEKVKNIIAVASGKGGVGKSTVAANIACSFSRKGYKVGLLDLDIYGPSLPIILGINESPKLTQDKKLVPLNWKGLKVLSFGFISGNDSPAIWRGPLVARMTEQFFRDVLWGDLDYLILDLPPGTGDVQLTLTQKIQISGAVIVTTPQDIALSDVRKGADMFRKVNTPVLGVIENMSGLTLLGTVFDSENNPLKSGTIKMDNKESTHIYIDDKGAFTVTIDLFKKGGGERESQRLGVPLLGKIPLSQAIMDSTDSGAPITFSLPDTSASKIFSDIVLQIENKLIS
ncbi:MAG: Mrp/NBP35 family ATP-binding protein [Candidatus Marinimicrobia bacterium]|jgi:ATP-binding protein involved in chromosome partitioning|nr:Mrp/NBP35 family ATP-binding protein [Candidatus Neomarinimicrobiota bacterium]